MGPSGVPESAGLVSAGDTGVSWGLDSSAGFGAADGPPVSPGGTSTLGPAGAVSSGAGAGAVAAGSVMAGAVVGAGAAVAAAGLEAAGLLDFFDSVPLR